MKKFGLFVSVAMLTALLLSACAPAAAPAPAAEKPAEKELVFAAVVKSIGDNWFVRLEEGVLKFGKDFKSKPCWKASNVDSAARVIIEDLIARVWT